MPPARARRELPRIVPRWSGGGGNSATTWLIVADVIVISAVVTLALTKSARERNALVDEAVTMAQAHLERVANGG